VPRPADEGGGRAVRSRRRAAPVVAALAAVAVLALTGRAAAHVGGLSGAGESGSVPAWLTVGTGGVVVGGSFLFTSLLTDHAAIRAINGWGIGLPAPGALRRAAAWTLRAASVGVLALVVVTGFVGPAEPIRNFAILVVWAGWWAGYTMTVYAVGDTWPAINPWRALAAALPDRPPLDYPDRAGAWPSVVGLLALVWVEVVSPVADDPRLLAGVVLAYSAVTLVGAVAYGPETWFGTVDPISRVFRCYGWMAPFQRTDDGIELKLPTAGLTEDRTASEPGGAAFVVALLWVTTYDGLVSTPAWDAAVRPVVGAGVPPLLVYLAAAVGGFVLFYRAFALASRRVRRSGDSYVAAEFVRRYFAPSLLPIAAGYHLAHFLGYFLSLSPPLAAVALSPFDPPTASMLVVPGWFGGVQLLFVLLGHLLAVWVAHSLAFELFPGVLKPIRSQYPFVVLMILYTMTSVWIIVQPFSPPPHV